MHFSWRRRKAAVAAGNPASCSGESRDGPLEAVAAAGGSDEEAAALAAPAVAAAASEVSLAILSSVLRLGSSFIPQTTCLS